MSDKGSVGAARQAEWPCTGSATIAIDRQGVTYSTITPVDGECGVCHRRVRIDSDGRCVTHLPPAGPLEALPSEAGGADARSPEAETLAAAERKAWDEVFPGGECDHPGSDHICLLCAAETVRARDAEWREAVNQYLNALTCHAGLSELAGAAEPLHALMQADAQRPSGSPSVPAAQPPEPCGEPNCDDPRHHPAGWAPTREAPAPLASLAEPCAAQNCGHACDREAGHTGQHRAESAAEGGADLAWIGEGRCGAEFAAAEPPLLCGRLPGHPSPHTAYVPDFSHECRHAVHWPSVEPRAAPTPALPREAPEPGGAQAVEDARAAANSNWQAFHGFPIIPRAAPSDAAPATPGPSPEDTQKTTLRAGETPAPQSEDT